MRGNLLDTALSMAAVAAAVAILRGQVDADGDCLDIVPKVLVVGPVLESPWPVRSANRNLSESTDGSPTGNNNCAACSLQSSGTASCQYGDSRGLGHSLGGVGRADRMRPRPFASSAATRIRPSRNWGCRPRWIDSPIHGGRTTTSEAQGSTRGPAWSAPGAARENSLQRAGFLTRRLPELRPSARRPWKHRRVLWFRRRPGSILRQPGGVGQVTGSTGSSSAKRSGDRRGGHRDRGHADRRGGRVDHCSGRRRCRPSECRKFPMPVESKRVDFHRGIPALFDKSCRYFC